ncbi:MAG: DNA alkylation repair protein [Chloroflexia bacterium]
MTLDEILAEMRGLGSARNREGMARFGINPARALGVSVNDLRRIGRKVRGKDHALAGQLWDTEIHEARILASIVDDPRAVTEEQMERWVAEFDSWDLCDQCCGNLFDKTAYAWGKAVEWSGREREFEKRAGFALMAYLGWHSKDAPDERFLTFLPVIKREAVDNRNYVKKAVNWALREIGKRNPALNAAAIDTAREILAGAEAQGKRGASRWVASDALRELTSEKVQARLQK